LQLVDTIDHAGSFGAFELVGRSALPYIAMSTYLMAGFHQKCSSSARKVPVAMQLVVQDKQSGVRAISVTLGTNDYVDKGDILRTIVMLPKRLAGKHMGIFKLYR
jgi:hypothetical protein